MRTNLVIQLCLLLLLGGHSVSAKAKKQASAKPAKVDNAELVVGEIQPDGNSFVIEAIGRNFKNSNPNFKLLDENGKEVASLGHGSSEPVNLWLLVDTSTLCQARNIDERVVRLVKYMKGALNENSLLSLVSYTNTTLEIHHNHRPLEDINATLVGCNKKLLSTSYEKALRHLLAKKESSNLPTVVWVYTSGNVSLSKQTLAALKKRNAEIHVLLYNPFVAADIRPVVQATRSKLGAENVRFTVLRQGSSLVPEIRRKLEFSPSFAMGGKRVRLRLATGDGEQVVKSAPFNLNVPKGNVFLHRYAKTLLWMAAFLFVCYLIYRLVRYYRPRYCQSCKRAMRYTDKHCGFCRKAEDAYLIGNFNLRDKHKLERKEVVHLASDKVELGTHRRSIVPIVRASHKRRACYATIEKETLSNNRMAFRLLRSASEEEVTISVNGYPLKTERYLSEGDVIVVDDVEMSFLTGKKSEEPNVA